MKALVVYGSTHGSTRAVVRRLPELLAFPVDTVDAADVADAAVLAPYDVLLFFASTWGDGELQVDMEHFFVRVAPPLHGKRYAICELGNYYGYDDFEFGALRIMQRLLEVSGGTELIEPLSMDSFPRRDWDALERWCRRVSARMAECA